MTARCRARVETSKKILLFCDITTALAVIAAFTVAVLGVEMTGLSEIVVALIGLSAAAHSFYFWKAKAENLSKKGLKDKITMNEEDQTWGGY